MTNRERWEELQARWAQGEPLTPAEESERLSLAEGDALAKKELDIFAALRARADSDGDPVADALIDRVLEQVGATPPLRLVVTGAELGRAVPAAARLRATRRWVVAAVSLAAVAAVATIGWFNRPNPALPIASVVPALPPAVGLKRAELVVSVGEVQVDGQASSSSTRMLAQDQVLTTGNGRACFAIQPGIGVCLDANTRIKLESLTAPHISVRVEQGLALATLSPRTVGETFALLAADVTATARGTVFAARRQGPDTEIVVVEGLVDVVRGAAAAARVGAHTSVLFSSAEGAATHSTISPTTEKRLLDLRSSSGSWPQAALAPAVPPAGSAEQPARPTASALLKAARTEMAAGKSRSALTLYEKLRTAYPSSVEANTVLPTMGKLELDLGQPQRALRSFDAYLAKPGVLAPEALAGKIRALRALGRSAAERSAIEQYVARYPNGLDTPSFRRRLTELEDP